MRKLVFNPFALKTQTKNHFTFYSKLYTKTETLLYHATRTFLCTLLNYYDYFHSPYIHNINSYVYTYLNLNIHLIYYVTSMNMKPIIFHLSRFSYNLTLPALSTYPSIHIYIKPIKYAQISTYTNFQK